MEMKRSGLMAGALAALLLTGSVTPTAAADAAIDNAPAANTLKSAVARALQENPEVRFEAEAMQALAAKIDQAAGGYYPSVNLDVSVGRAKKEHDNRGSYDRQYAELSVTQMLFDGFDVSSQVDEAQYKVREQYYNLLSEAEDKGLEVTRAYLEVRKYRRLVALARQNVERHLTVMDQVRKRAEQGVGNQADLDQADGRLALARSNLRTEQRNLQSVTARYQRLVGEAPETDLAQVNFAGVEPKSLDAALSSAFAANPELQSTFENIGAAHSALDIARADNYPTVELGLRQGVYHNTNGFDDRYDPNRRGQDGLIELRARYNLFRGGSDRAAQRAAGERIEQAESLRDKACVDLRQTTTIAWTDLRNVQRNLASLKRHRRASDQVVDAYRQQFNIGRRSLLDVLDAENEAFQASRNLVHGRYDERENRARVLHGMGRLLSRMELSPAMAATDLPEVERHDARPQRYCAAVNDALVQVD